MSPDKSSFRQQIQRQINEQRLGMDTDNTIDESMIEVRKETLAKLAIERSKLASELRLHASEVADLLNTEGVETTHSLKYYDDYYSRRDKRYWLEDFDVDIGKKPNFFQRRKSRQAITMSCWIFKVDLLRSVNTLEIGGGYGTEEHVGFIKGGLALTDQGSLVIFSDKNTFTTDLTEDLWAGTGVSDESLIPLADYEKLGSLNVLADWQKRLGDFAVRLTTTSDILPPRPWHNYSNPAEVKAFVARIEDTNSRYPRRE